MEYDGVYIKTVVVGFHADEHCGSTSPGLITAKRENGNKMDSFAVMVLDQQGTSIGRIQWHDAKRVSALIDATEGKCLYGMVPEGRRLTAYPSRMEIILLSPGSGVLQSK